MKNKTFIYGKYAYPYTEIRENRKTFSLIVNPSKKIILKVPKDAKREKVESFLKRKWMWLEKQLQYFEKFQRKVYKKEYVSGESFLYLGKQYKLKVTRSKNEDVKLTKSVLILTTNKGVRNGTHNKRILDNWYNSRRDIKFFERYKVALGQFKYDFTPKLVVRKMKKRWGSYLGSKKIILNPELIKAPTDCIDYVITHELCHMKHKNHNADFYEFLESKIPNWKDVKEKLEVRLR